MCEWDGPNTACTRLQPRPIQALCVLEGPFGPVLSTQGQTCSTDTHEGPLRVLQALYSDGLGITKSDLLVIDKIDLAPHVGADLDIMRQDTARMRPDAQRRPWVMRNLKTREGLQEVVDFIVTRGMLAAN